MRNKFNTRIGAYKKIVRCSCGSEAKQRVKRNYPFGRNSKCRKVTQYVCINCGKKQ